MSLSEETRIYSALFEIAQAERLLFGSIRSGIEPLCFLLRPIGQALSLVIGEAGDFVHSNVAGQRHAAIAHGIGDVIPFSRSFLGIVMRPLGKIQSLARIANVAIQPP